MKTKGKKILMVVMILALALCWVTAAMANNKSYYIDFGGMGDTDTSYCMYGSSAESSVKPVDGCTGITFFGKGAGASSDGACDDIPTFLQVSGMKYNSAFGYEAILIGHTEKSTAIGARSHAWASSATSIGAFSYAGEESTALGADANAGYSDNSVAIGANSVAGDLTKTAPEVRVNNATAIGANATASHKNSVALGYNSATAGENEVSVGYYNSDTDKLYRKITNVADGVADTDAATVGQLKAIKITMSEDGNYYLKNDAVTTAVSNIDTQVKKNEDAIDTINASAPMTSGITAAKVNKYETYVTANGLNANDKAIKNVAAGELSATSTEAVNGSQLYATNQQVATNTNAIAVINASDPMNSGITAAKVDKYEKYVTESGLNANSKEISNVKAMAIEKDGTYAATTGQLYEMGQAAIDAQRQFAETNKEVQEVAAMSAALAGLHYLEPSGEGDDKVTGAVSYGGYRSENATAVGLAYKPNPNLMFSASTSIGNSQQAYNAGMSFRFGKGKTTNRAEMAKQIKYLSEENTELKTTVKVLLERMEQLEKKLK